MVVEIKSFLKHILYETIFSKTLESKRIDYIKNYVFSQDIIDRFQLDYEVEDKDVEIIIQHLKLYFSLFTSYKKVPCAMPSRKVDDLWHTFILFTKEYHKFCHKSFGEYLHHNPDKKNTKKEEKNQSSKNTFIGLVNLQKNIICMAYTQCH